jgi:hypothetical protein
MKKKTKCYEVGGEVEFETKTGRNENIGDDVRERAMAAMAAREAGETEKPAPKATPKAAPKAVAPKAEPKAAPKTKESSFKEGASSFKDSSSAFKKGTSSFKESTSSFKKMASGGKVSSASKRADGCATKGKTKGRMV